MNDLWVELVYDSLQGHLVNPLPGVENAFAQGSECEQLYGNMLAAYERLCERLGAGEDDGDVEIIIHSLLQIQKIVGMKMYSYGVQFGKLG